RVGGGEAQIKTHIASFDPAEIVQPVFESRNALLDRAVAFGSSHQYADPSHTGRLLRQRRDRPRSRATQPHDELAPVHSITWSAMAISAGGTVRPNILAVIRFQFELSGAYYWQIFDACLLEYSTSRNAHLVVSIHRFSPESRRHRKSWSRPLQVPEADIGLLTRSSARTPARA